MARIGVFDSGVGGLSVLKELLRVLPSESFFYYADSAHCPYGGKSREYVTDRSISITETLLSEGCQIIVLACNTATSAAISSLRSRFPVPFVGMEPAIKPAALKTESGVIGVLATAGTLSGSKYLDMKDRFSCDVKVVEQVGRGFVEIVEKMASSGVLSPDAYDTVAASLAPLVDAGADTVVLGCTHYPFLLPVLRDVAHDLCPSRDIAFINPAPAVARRVVSVLTDNNLLETVAPASKQKPEVRLLTSGSQSDLNSAFKNLI